MTNKALSIFNQLRPVSVGFDNVFDHFERMFEDDFRVPSVNYPPYNIVKTGTNKYDIEVALAGYNKKDIDAYKKSHQSEWGAILGEGPVEIVLEGSEAEDFDNVEAVDESTL